MVVNRVDRSGFDPDLAPIGFEFFGHEHGQRGIDPLAHLGVVDDHRDGVVRADADEGIGRKSEASSSFMPELAAGLKGGMVVTEFSSRCGLASSLQLGRQMNGAADTLVGPAAADIAGHAASMSASVGPGFFRSRAAADMICPGMQ